MKLYFKFFRNAFLSNFTYKIDILFRFVKSFIGLFVQISVWTALFKGNFDKSGINLSLMISYSIISTGVSCLVDSRAIYTVEDRIRTGIIATDLIRPVNFMGYIFSISIGNNIYNFLFQFIPLVFIFCPIFGLYLPSSERIIPTIISMLGGILINFLLSYILGLVGFWYLSVWHLGRLLSDSIRLFSGAFIPLWFFPDVLYQMALFLPFRFIYFVPISIFLGELKICEIPSVLTVQWLWIVFLFCLSQLIWKYGKKKLVVQGG